MKSVLIFLFLLDKYIYICYLQTSRTTMERREFLRMCGGLFVMSQLPASLSAKNAGAADVKGDFRNLKHLTIDVGATSPFSALHISDSHLTRVDGRENERKHVLARKRSKIFPDAEHYFSEALRYASAKNLLLLHTGDLIDFVSEANLDHVEKMLSSADCLASSGNHEFSQYVGEAKEDALYKAQSYDRVQKAYPNDLTFASFVVNGVNFVAVDDVYYNFTKEQKLLMKKEVKKGLPIVMLCHVPLYTPGQCQSILDGNGGKCGYVTGAPLEITSKYPDYPDLPPDKYWKNRSVQQKADKPTLDFISWLKKQPELKAILCGHTHAFYQEQFSPTAVQYTVGAAYKGDAYEIEFI